MAQKPARKIINELTGPRIAEAVGVVPSAVRNASAEGILPASWYASVRALCAEQDIDCPVSAFKMKPPFTGPDDPRLKAFADPAVAEGQENQTASTEGAAA